MNPQHQHPLFPKPFRWAAVGDSAAIARLMDMAGEGLPRHLWSGLTDSGQSPMEVGAELVARGEGNFSYRNAVVAEKRGEVVALLLAYRLPPANQAPDPADYPELERPMVELEARVPGSFYINGLATLLQARKQGLGSCLLHIANALAVAEGCQELSIQVFEQNTTALRLYQQHGYEIVDRRSVVPHACYPYDTDVLLLTRNVARWDRKTG